MDHGSQGLVRAPERERRPAPAQLVVPAGPRTWTLSPSDLFLWRQCPRCLVEKILKRKPRPKTAFPKVFGVIDRAMKDFYVGGRAEELIEGAPPGVIASPDRWVRSAPLFISGCRSLCVIRGRLDLTIECDDGTLGILDLKTSHPSTKHLATYEQQLECYATALAQPARGLPACVSRLGLVMFCPDVFRTEGRRAAVAGSLQYHEVSLPGPSFCHGLAEAISALDGSSIPLPSGECPWCHWNLDRRRGVLQSST